MASSLLARASAALASPAARPARPAAAISLARTASASASAAATRAYSTNPNIRESGGAFSKKEAAQEDKYIYDHDKELLQKLKKNLSQPAASASASGEPAAAPKPAAAEEDGDRIRISPIDSGYGGAVRTGGGALGKKEAAQEEKFFRDLDKEKVEKLKKH
ncbi:hypothetical protein HK405_009665 [Cladochytrium tenue]|nr:hypothetical protein HK405_009665 [Cladochytrium tenue]